MTRRVIIVETTRTYVAVVDTDDRSDIALHDAITGDDPVDESITWHDPDPAETTAFADDIAYLAET